MEKIKKPFRDWSLRASFVLYIVVFLGLALLASGFTQNALEKAGDDIRAAYSTDNERYYLTNAQGEQLGEGAVIYGQPRTYAAKDERRLAVYETVRESCAAVYVTAAILLAAMLFYRNKLKRPLAILELASEKIMAQELDFTITYERQDEMGRLCRSFEQMRQALWQNNRQMWRQMEERRRINAAFAHDLRTPLTILKGYTDLLLLEDKPSKQMIQETAQTMAAHVERLEKYTQTMSELQKLEDLSPVPAPCQASVFFEALHQSASILCEQKPCCLIFQAHGAAEQLFVDEQFVQRVWENLLANAVRYAQTTVYAAVAETDGQLLLQVTDDGQGFSEKALQQADWPYFTEESAAGHEGLGLYVSKLLCIHHGGYLTLGNCTLGATAEAVFAQKGIL